VTFVSLPVEDLLDVSTHAVAVVIAAIINARRECDNLING